MLFLPILNWRPGLISTENSWRSANECEGPIAWFLWDSLDLLQGAMRGERSSHLNCIHIADAKHEKVLFVHHVAEFLQSCSVMWRSCREINVRSQCYSWKLILCSISFFCFLFAADCPCTPNPLHQTTTTTTTIIITIIIIAAIPSYLTDKDTWAQDQQKRRHKTYRNRPH